MFFISDTHFGHTNIIKYSSRPFSSVEEMNEKMIENWNGLVKPEDEVFHMGDFAFLTYQKLKTVVRRLNGRKHLILGNHDQEITKFQQELLDCRVSPGLFTSIQHYREVKAGGEMICLFHYGQRVWNKSHRGSIQLYGHSHGSLPPHGKSVDVGVDAREIIPGSGPDGRKTSSEYRPIHLDEVLSYMAKRPSAKEDYHGRNNKKE